MTGDVRKDEYFVGRAEELRELVRNLERGRHTLLLGPKGVGKTRLMQQAIRVMGGSAGQTELFPGTVGGLGEEFSSLVAGRKFRMLYVMHTSPLGDCMKEMSEGLHSQGLLRLGGSAPTQGDWGVVRKSLTGLGSIRLQESIVESIRLAPGPFIVFFDSLDRIAPTQGMFLEAILSNAVVCAAVVQVKDGFVFKKIWSSFVRIKVEPFNERASMELVDHLLDTYGINVSDRRLYRSEICKSANGNPFHIKNLIWQGSRESRLDTEAIRKLRRTEEGEFFNMGPIFIFMASVLTLFKIFSIGTDNREFYIYFSALGFIVYIAFRVFRTFFLFRPQRNK
jgi:hypothetical protein